MVWNLAAKTPGLLQKLMPPSKPAAVAQPALMDRLRPKTIPSLAAGNPMTQPLQQQASGGDAVDAVIARLEQQQKPLNFNTPYYQARKARNATGQGSPYIPGGERLSPEVRQAGYAMMAQPAAPAARPLGERFRPQQPSMNPPPGESPATPPAPIGTRLVGGVEFSNTNRPGMNTVAQNRLMPPETRESLLARLQGGMGNTPTLEQAAADPNFNKAGNLFQGAKLGVNPQGQAFFREGQRAPDFAGNAQNAGEAAANRLATLQGMQRKGIGEIDKETGAMFGYGGIIAQPVSELRGRLAAGGIWNSTLTDAQANANRTAMLQRMADKRDLAQRLRNDKMSQMIAQRNSFNPQINMLMQNNPELGLKLMALQQQGELAKAQMGLQEKQFGLQGQELQQRGQLAQAQLAQQAQLAGDNRTFQEKLAALRMGHERELQQGNPEFALRKAEMDARNQLGKDQLSLQERLAGAANQAKKEELTSRERLARLQGVNQLAAGAAGAAFDNEEIDPNERLMYGIDAAEEVQRRFGGGGGAASVAGGGAAAVGAARPDSLLSRLSPKTYANGLLTKFQFDKLKEQDDPTRARDDLRAKGFTDEQITVALNAIWPPWYITGGALDGASRSADDPGGWGNALRERYYDPKTGKPVPLKGLGSILSTHGQTAKTDKSKVKSP